MNLISTLIVLGKKQKKELSTCVPDCAEVEEQLSEILLDDPARLRQAYCILEPVISIQSRSRGPRNFRKLLDEIFEFIRSYSYDRVQAYQEQIVILNLTYYEKVFRDSLTLSQKTQILIIFAITNIHAFLRNSDLKRLNSVQDKLNEANELKIQDNYFMNVLLLLSAVLTHLRCEHKRAKTLFANLFTKIIGQKQVLKNHNNLEIMAICAYYSYLNLSALGEYELACYYLTKASQFGRKLEKASRFVQKIKQIGQHNSFFVVKLTRIENKLQVLKRTKSSWHSKTMKTKIYTQKKQDNKGQVEEELQNIFTIKDTKSTMYKFRKDNLRYLNGEENKLTINIKKKQEELVEISKFRANLGKRQEIQDIQKQIMQLREDKGEIKEEYEELKFKYLKDLKQAKVLNRYLKSYIQQAQFKKMSYIYNFLYGKMFSRAKIFILSLFLKRRIRKVKKVVKKMKIVLGGLLHFAELFEIVENNTELIIYKKKQTGFYLKIYPIENRPPLIPIEDEKKISEHVFKQLLQVPLCYQFEPIDTKMISWQQYLGQKNFLTIHYVKRFVQRLTKKYKAKQNPEIYKINNVYLKFGSVVSIETKLFTSTTVAQGHGAFEGTGWQGTIYTIGGPKYHNSMYNITINSSFVLNENISVQETALSFVTDEWMRRCSERIDAIRKIQKFIKLAYCKKKVKGLKNKTKIAVFVQGADIITFCKYLMGKSFLIAENIVTKDREVLQTIMDFNSFREIAFIKDKLFKEKTCKDKLKLTCKYIWTRFFVTKLKDHIKNSAIMTDFQISFRNRIIFTKIFNCFIYKKKLVSSKIAFSLTVESLLQFPRPYILRIYTVQKGVFIVDIAIKIFNRDKLFYEKNAESLNKMLNILSRTEMEILCQQEENETQGGRRRSSRMSQSSRGSRVRVIHSITNLSSDDEIKTSSVEAEIIPKITCKKTSMLARFRNRRSNQLARSDHSACSNRNSNCSSENKSEEENHEGD